MTGEGNVDSAKEDSSTALAVSEFTMTQSLFFKRECWQKSKRSEVQVENVKVEANK